MYHSLMKLISNAELYAPEYLGRKDILIGGGKILAVDDHIELDSHLIEKIDAGGHIVLPGLIDGHVHVIGGGGEDGCLSRVPPLREQKIAQAGVTSLVGLLGTDGYSRTVRDLVAKTKGIRQWGLSAWCLTGSYQVPSPTLTGSIGDDILFIDEIIGVKVAVSDHRCSLPTTEELLRMATEARLASLMAGKCGIVHIHVGADKRGIEDLFRIAETSPLPIKHFYPTHMGGHLEQSEKWLKLGGHIDVTCSKDVVNATLRLMKTDTENLTLSTDSNGSFPKWNEKKEIIGMGAGSILKLYETVQNLISEKADRSTVYKLVTENPATAMRLSGKGRIETGYDADILILDDKENIDKVYAKGELFKNGEWVKPCMYDDI